MHRAQFINQPMVEPVSAFITGGLVAAMTGTTNDAVLNFAGAATLVGPTGFITATNSATDGTEIGITSPGLYLAELGGTLGASASCIMGISQDVVPLGLTTDPDFANAGTLAVLGATAPAATVIPFYLSALITVRMQAAGVAGGSVVRFHGTDGADGAPAGLTQASWFARVTKVAELAA